MLIDVCTCIALGGAWRDAVSLGVVTSRPAVSRTRSPRSQAAALLLRIVLDLRYHGQNPVRPGSIDGLLRHARRRSALIYSLR